MAAIAIVSSTGSAQGGDRTITAVETLKGSVFTYVDNPPRSNRAASVGDELTFGNKLLANGQRLGRFDVNCVITRTNRSRDKPPYFCHGMAVLSDGTLDVSAAVRPGHPIVGPINGGTGAYEGAGGHFTSEFTDNKHFVDTFTVIRFHRSVAFSLTEQKPSKPPGCGGSQPFCPVGLAATESRNLR